MLQALKRPLDPRSFNHRAGQSAATLDLTEVGEGLGHDAMDRGRVGQVEIGESEPVVVLGLEIIRCIHLAHAHGNAVAALNVILPFKEIFVYTHPQHRPGKDCHSNSGDVFGKTSG